MSRSERIVELRETEGEAGSRRGRHRGRRGKPRQGKAGAVTLGTAALLIAGAGGWLAFGPQGVLTSAAASRPTDPLPRAAAAADGGSPVAGHTELPAADRSNRYNGTVSELPGLGPDFRARIPAHSSQVLLVSGAGRNSTHSLATLWTRTPDGRWRPGATWSAHNALRGWTADHHLDDLRSPIGVYSLSDAGGLAADPGSRLPYYRSRNFTVSGRGFEGDNLAGSFDYVVAIDYNRLPGTSPLDGSKPQGAAKGGGIWVHVDHGGPTHACVSLAEADMVRLLRSLDPAARPVIVMGDRDSLAT